MLDLIDIGANLTHDSFDSDRDELMARAQAAGVRRIIVTGTSVTTTAQAVELAAGRPGHLYATAGVHPHHATELDRAALDAIAVLAQNDSVVAIGECGLDFFRNFSPPESQVSAFRDQLELAVHSRLPVFLHQRDAHEEFVELLRPVRQRLIGGVAHCFTGGIEELTDCLDLDLYIGVTGWVCDERRGGRLQEAVSHIPLERLLLETDAPYLLPRTLQPKPGGRRNEPAHLPHIARTVAELMQRDVEEVARAATRNAETLFSLKAAAPSTEASGDIGDLAG
jgi:TatD DNase family protein